MPLVDVLFSNSIFIKDVNRIIEIFLASIFHLEECNVLENPLPPFVSALLDSDQTVFTS